MIDRQFVALKAFIVHNGKVLILRESSEYEDGINTGIYDVVGGRLDPGENWHDGLVREIQEETGLTVQVGTPFTMGEWRPEVRGEKWQIVATFFECQTDTDDVILSQDHDGYEWIVPGEYKNYNLNPNLVDVFEKFCSIRTEM